MANEINARISLKLNNAGAILDRQYNNQIDNSLSYYQDTVQLIGTTEETINIPTELTTPGYAIFKNYELVNYVEIGSAPGSYLIKLNAGEAALFRLTTSTIYAKANTSSVPLGVTIIND